MQEHIQKAYGFQQHWYSSRNTKVFCLGDRESWCRTEPSYIAVRNNYEGDGLALGVCQRYFRLGTLNGIYDSVKNGDGGHDLSQYENRARAWITAIMRIKWIANLTPLTVFYPGTPPVGGKAESASQVKYVAKNYQIANPTKDAIANPSNYAWYALAQWVQQKSGNYAHRPQTPIELARAW